MNYKFLADTNLQIPEIGLGTWNYSGGTDPLKKGIDMGANFIDTAEGYYTEDIVGKAIKGRRKEVVIATKVSGRNLAHDDVLRSAERSLEKLQSGYIDLYQIHWPNPVHPIRETMSALQKLVDRGLVQYIGVSNFSVEEMKEAQHFLPHSRIVSNQVLYNLNSRGIENELLPFCMSRNITVLAYTPLDSGALCRVPGRFGRGKYKVLSKIAEEVGSTMGQVALNWCICHENVVAIPKSDSVERTTENCLSSGWYLEDEQIEGLNNAFS